MRLANMFWKQDITTFGSRHTFKYHVLDVQRTKKQFSHKSAGKYIVSICISYEK
jgi:hypothetical protein